MQQAFVTGATGFLGAHLVCALLQKGYNVKALKRPNSSLTTFDFIAGLYFGHGTHKYSDHLAWADGDLNHYDEIESLIEPGMFVFHCAAMVSFRDSDKKQMLEVNIKGTENIVNACIAVRCRKLIYASSTAAIGKAADEAFTDESDWWDEKDRPSGYSISKYYAELEVWRGTEEGLAAVIVNPPLIIGPGDWKKNTGKFFSNAFRNFPFYTEGHHSFVYVKDVADVMIRLAESDLNAERYLLVSENLPLKQFMDMVARNFQKRSPWIKINRFIAGIAWRILGVWSFITGKEPMITRESTESSFKKVYFSNQKITRALNYQFTPMQQAVRETVNAYLHSVKK